MEFSYGAFPIKRRGSIWQNRPRMARYKEYKNRRDESFDFMKLGEDDFYEFDDVAIRYNEVFIPGVPMNKYSDTGYRFRYNEFNR